MKALVVPFLLIILPIKIFSQDYIPNSVRDFKNIDQTDIDVGDYKSFNILNDTLGLDGIDFSVNTYLNSVHLHVQYSSNKKKDLNIPGFSGSQVLFGLNVTGKLIKLLESE
ncbi:hypothetical protein [Hyunsoonleella pacifica]|uniref:Uncharacterized protein n=1 Tax=Hyunsoonleella pacifica TaxID=1080224 RepID=A0A4Q9FQH3_9FLAO|nr:hypothetical protein [Hyunsoonleella pacifica]TBN17755.1 hypothetical protein EYD46_05415 [Hyunsoonleella pacifica]GGD09200.1 hypothetical protein GCM10011368_08990 [Hyunsoonleella pacifica]